MAELPSQPYALHELEERSRGDVATLLEMGLPCHELHC